MKKLVLCIAICLLVCPLSMHAQHDSVPLDTTRFLFEACSTALTVYDLGMQVKEELKEFDSLLEFADLSPSQLQIRNSWMNSTIILYNSGMEKLHTYDSVVRIMYPAIQQKKHARPEDTLQKEYLLDYRARVMRLEEIKDIGALLKANHSKLLETMK